MTEAAAEFDRVNAEQIENILIDDGQLLNGVIYAHQLRR